MFLEAMDDISDPLAPKVPSIAQGMRILLVDRDTTSLMFMASILEAYSYKVTTIEIFSIAMAIYKERKDEFDVIMANVHLHNATDVEFVQEIIKRKNTPIILMSIAGAGALREQDQLEGASQCYEKPLSCSQLRDVWQLVYRYRLSKGAAAGKKINRGNIETEYRLHKVEEPAMTRKNVGIQIREGGGGGGSRNPAGNDFPAVDPKGKNKQVIVEDAPATKTEPLTTIERSGRDRKRANDDEDDSAGKKRTEKNRSSSSSQRKKGLRWSKELHFKFTAAISKLGEEKANPKAIQELMNVPNLSQRQIANQLERYKTQVQLIMDTCKGTQPWIPPSYRNAWPANVTTTPAPYLPPLQYSRQNPTPNPTIFTRLSKKERQRSEAGAPTSSGNPPPGSNPPAGASTTTAAGASANPNIPTGNGGVNESTDDLAFLMGWLSRSLKADDTGYQAFDWSDTHIS